MTFSAYTIQKRTATLSMICMNSHPLLEPPRGSWNVVVLVLWSTKYLTPSAVYLISHPSGRGSSCIILYRKNWHIICTNVQFHIHAMIDFCVPNFLLDQKIKLQVQYNQYWYNTWIPIVILANKRKVEKLTRWITVIMQTSVSIWDFLITTTMY